MLRIARHTLRKNAESLEDEAFAEFNKTLDDIEDPVMFLLQAHLYLEQFLERLICVLFPNGEEVIDEVQWSFQQKLLIVHSVGFLPKGTVAALKQLNSIRNRLAHRLRYTASIEDMRKLSANLPEYRELFDRFRDEPLKALQALTTRLIGELGTWTFIFENAEVAADDARKGNRNG